MNMLHPVAELISSYDPDTSYLLKLVYRRARLIPVTPPEDIAPERRAEIEAEAAVIALDDALALARAMLDEYYPG